MKRKKLFGNNIDVSCNYCQNAVFDNECCYCSANKIIKNGKCKKFEYNPTLRLPKRETPMPSFSALDFII